MRAAEAAGQAWPASAYRRRLATGIAFAAALSLAVHAAVLLGRASAGSATPSAVPLAAVLSTRSVVATIPPLATEVPKPVPPRADKPPPELSSAIAPRRAALEAPPDDHAAARAVQSRTSDPVASAVSVESPTATAPLPVAPPPAYMGSGSLDPPPRPLGDIDPALPAEAGARGGVVVLRLFINERGGVDKAEVLNSAPPGLFDASALAAFGNARFSPGYIAGVPVKSQVTFEVKFRGLGSGAAASGRTY